VYSYDNYARLRKAKPNLNRLQIVLLQQKQLYKLHKMVHKSRWRLFTESVVNNFSRKYEYAKKEVLHLARSRILQTFMLLPLMYLSYNVG